MHISVGQRASSATNTHRQNSWNKWILIPITWYPPSPIIGVSPFTNGRKKRDSRVRGRCLISAHNLRGNVTGCRPAQCLIPPSRTSLAAMLTTLLAHLAPPRRNYAPSPRGQRGRPARTSRPAVESAHAAASGHRRQREHFNCFACPPRRHVTAQNSDVCVPVHVDALPCRGVLDFRQGFRNAPVNHEFFKDMLMETRISRIGWSFFFCFERSVYFIMCVLFIFV